MRKPSGCPICNNAPTRAYMPFCSKRCADIDLNRWFNEGYSVPGEEGDHAEDNPSGDEVMPRRH
ncbi:MAG: DNA gyrase inhibitor YacG [Pseudomonadota bacterium]